MMQLESLVNYSEIIEIFFFAFTNKTYTCVILCITKFSLFQRCHTWTNQLEQMY